MVKKTHERSTKGSSKQIEEDLDISQGSWGVKSYFFFAIIGIVIIAAVILMVTNSVNTGKKTEGFNDEPSKTNQGATEVTDMASLIKRISELIIVNPEEEPTVATVQDAEILRATNPNFYKDAKDGDRLLVWSDKAILYSTEEDRLISVMLISATSTEAVAPSEEGGDEDVMTAPSEEEKLASALESEEAVIQIRNGTRTAGLAKKLSNKLKEEGLTVGLSADARLKDYEKTVILKISDKEMPATIKELVDLTGAEVLEQAPDGETGLGDDLVIFIGADYEEYLQ